MELKIRWQRLRDPAGSRCESCLRTLNHVRTASAKLRKACHAFGIEVPPVEVSRAASGAMESNRVWINDRPLEQWLGAEVGRSDCRCVCGKHDCRALYLKGRRYEGVPEELLLRAGLTAMLKLLEPKEESRERERDHWSRPATLH
jgi:uncharacterized protein DUF2703